MVKRLLLPLFLLTVFVGLHAAFFQDRVYLRNGTYVDGTVIEQVPDDYVKIRTSRGDVLVFRMYEVERIQTQAVNNKPSNRQSSSIGKSSYHIFKIGMLTAGRIYLQDAEGSIKMDNEVFTISGITGLQVADLFGIGIGAEWDNYAEGALLPVFLDVRGNLYKDKNSATFIFGDVGGALNMDKHASETLDRGGAFLYFGGGATIYNLMVDIGLKLQSSEAWFVTQDHYLFKDQISYNTIAINVGASF